MRLARACGAAVAAVLAVLVCTAAPVQAEDTTKNSTDQIDIAIVGYTPNVGDITVQVKVTSKIDKNIGVIVHIPGQHHQQRTLFKKGTVGQDSITEPVKVPCDKAQYLIVEYSWDNVTLKPGVTSVPQKCQVAHKRDQERDTQVQPKPSPSGELAKTGESGLWWAVRVGPLAVIVGVALLLAGRRPRFSG